MILLVVYFCWQRCLFDCLLCDHCQDGRNAQHPTVAQPWGRHATHPAAGFGSMPALTGHAIKYSHPARGHQRFCSSLAMSSL